MTKVIVVLTMDKLFALFPRILLHMAPRDAIVELDAAPVASLIGNFHAGKLPVIRRRTVRYVRIAY